MSRMYVPTVRELEDKLKLVEIEVEGQYIAMIDEKRRTSRIYKTKLLVPEGFTKSEIKRLVPKQLQKEKDDFMSLRTFQQVGDKATKTEKTMKRKELYSSVELARFEKLRADEERMEALRRGGGSVVRGGVQDDTEYDPNTGLPPVING